MSDLISRRELIKHFEAIQQEENVVGLVFVAAIDEIKGQPTAYSVDNVIEELELHSFELGTDTLPVHYVRLNDAIEIVKQKGDDNDVCEWRCDAYGRWHTRCNILADNDPLEYTYCPYCGRKIEAVK
ncbi:MAG: hypothetical protein SPF36_07940 [Lachnospiraceae bacterium]|nr:hypothetical protein [Lachnospiraceae bacterium]